MLYAKNRTTSVRAPVYPITLAIPTKGVDPSVSLTRIARPRSAAYVPNAKILAQAPVVPTPSVKSSIIVPRARVFKVTVEIPSNTVP